MKAFLKSPESGVLPLRPKITLIGRHEDADIVLKSAGVEDHHAALEFSEKENGFILRDFNSVQGTFVNDCQVQNAAVRVSPGDLLRFGAGGSAFELTLDNTPQVSYPLVSRRTAWPGQLQVVTEAKSPPATATTSQFPVLPSPPSPPVSRSWSCMPSGASPHPPCQKKPFNAWGRAVTSPAFSLDAFARPSPGVEGNGFARGPLTNVHQGDALPKERDDVISRLGSEIGRLSAFESECGRKDVLIAELRAEIAAMNDRSAAPKREAEFRQKLTGLEQEVVAKAEEIRALREQINNLQKNTSEVLYRSLSERDLQIAHWKHETEALKKSYSLTTGLVTSLQKDVTVKDQTIQQLKRDAEKLRREKREKDNQLARVSAQCSRIKEEVKRELLDREANAYENRMAELDLQARRSEDDLKKSQTEQETLTKQLAQKSKAEGELRQECARRSQQLQEMGRRERLIRSDLDLAATQAQSFRHQLTETLFFQLPEESVTEQQIVEKVKQLQAANVEYCRKEIELREEMRAKGSEAERASEDVKALQKALEGVQDFLQTPYCSHSLRKEVSGLRGVHLTPPASGVRAATVHILGSLLHWVEATEGLLRDLDVDLSGCGKGMSSYMKKLREHHRDSTLRLQAFQNQQPTAEESQQIFLQEKLTELKDRLQEEFQGKEREILEAEKEHRKVLEGMIALEEAKLKDAVEDEKRKVEGLETRAKQLAEVIEQKAKSESALHARITETLEDMEAAQTRKALAEEKFLVCEKRLKSLEKEAEAQRRRHREEISEYKEQVKQHSHTIVGLENKCTEAARHTEEAREENGKLRQQIEEMQRGSCQSRSPEATSPERSHVFLKEELEAARRRILSDEAIVVELKKELSEARARVSDAIGELSEKQKMELERKRSLVQSQAHEIGHLQEELFETRNLVGQKDADLSIVREELRNLREKLNGATKQTKETDRQHTGVQTEAPWADEAAGKGPVSDLSGLGLRCKGSRHEETIRRQKEALAELRHRIKALERASPLDFEERKPEALIVCKKSPAEQKTETEQGTAVVTTAGAKLQSRVDPNVTIERTAKLEMADALDLSENMYLDLMRDLANLVDLKELVGTRTVMHLPPDEREKVKNLRQKDLKLLCGKIGQMKSRLERKESLLKEYEKDIGKFRTNHQTLRACQSEIAKLGDRIYQEKAEKALLKEALERTRLQLIQERRLNRALKHHKHHLEEKRGPVLPCRICTQKFGDAKVGKCPRGNGPVSGCDAATPKKTSPESPKMVEGGEKKVPFKDAA